MRRVSSVAPETTLWRGTHGRAWWRDLYIWALSKLGLSPALLWYTLAVFALSRLAFYALTVLVIHVYHLTPPPILLEAWTRYDATYYARIAHDGYSSLVPARTAFFPLYPLVIHLIAWPFETKAYDADYVAALIVANLSFLLALLGIAALAVREFGALTARRAVLYLTVYPMAFFTFAGYSESLFLALAIWCMVALRRGAWWRAGALGLLAAMTRQMGVFLLLPFIWEYGASIGWRPRDLRLDALAGLLIPGGITLFMGWLWITVGDPLAFAHVERFWGHTFTLPWQTLANAVDALIHQSYRVAFIAEALDLGMVALFALLIVVGIWALRPGAVLYAAAVWLLALSYPTTGWPLTSDARYMLAAFPCFLLLARGNRLRWPHALLLTLSAALALVMAQYFLRGGAIL